MVFCIIAIIVFGFLGIFSAKYRSYFRESLHCIKRTAMLKPCDTEFDRRMKAKITSNITKKSEILGKFVYRRFEAISWVFVVILLVSLFFTGLSIYNLYVYGNCNGPESADICLFNPDGASISSGETKFRPELVTADNDPYLGNGNFTIIEFGCHACPYTRKAESVVKELINKYENQIKIVFRDYPVSRHKLSTEAAEAAECAYEQDNKTTISGRRSSFYWKYHDKLFENQKELSNDTFYRIANEVGLDIDRFTSCYESEKYKEEVKKDFADGESAGVYGTPTFFIGNSVIVGAKPIEEFEKAINGENVTILEAGICTD